MPRPMMFFVSVILFMPLATVLVTAQTSLAEPAAEECKTKPGSSAPPGRHWYYLINRTDQRRCWFLGPEGAKVRSQARETASRSEERRVGKECRSRGSPYHKKRKSERLRKSQRAEQETRTRKTDRHRTKY